MTRCTSPRARATVEWRQGVAHRAPPTSTLRPTRVAREFLDALRSSPPPQPSLKRPARARAPPSLAPPPVPRILFYTPSHDLMDITSGNDKFKYFYGEDAAIAANMQQAVARVAAGAKVAEEWEKPQDL